MAKEKRGCLLGLSVEGFRGLCLNVFLFSYFLSHSSFFSQNVPLLSLLPDLFDLYACMMSRTNRSGLLLWAFRGLEGDAILLIRLYHTHF